jgi:hypothetical protein
MNLVVSGSATDAWAIAAAIAAVVAAVAGVIAILFARAAWLQAKRQTVLAELAFDAATKELVLAESQLRSTEEASKQTLESLDLSRKQVEYMQRADVDRKRALAPRVVATMKQGGTGSNYIMYLSNSGATAAYLLVTGHDSAGGGHREFVQNLDPGESRAFAAFTAAGEASYCQFVRIRYRDVLGNRYITEYRSLGANLAYPIFRSPWIGEGIVPRPERCSEEVSWPVESIERSPGEFDEPVEVGFNINDPV